MSITIWLPSLKEANIKIQPTGAPSFFFRHSLVPAADLERWAKLLVMIPSHVLALSRIQQTPRSDVDPR